MSDREGRQWVAYYSPADPAEMGPPTTTAAVPAMLSLGRFMVEDRPPADLLVNLEHFGSIAVCGATEQVFGAIRAMIFELASGGQICHTSVTTVDFEVEGAGGLVSITAAREEEALKTAATAASAPGLQVYVVVRATDAKLDRWFELSRPGSGVAVILIGDVRSSRLGSRFVVGADGSGEFHGLGTKVQVFGIDGSTAAAVEELMVPAGARYPAPASAPEIEPSAP